MEKTDAKKSASTSLVRTLVSFTVVGFAIYIAIITINMIGNIVWVDFIHYNPNRSQSNALIMIVLSPIDGLIFSLMDSELPLIVGTIVAIIRTGFGSAFHFTVSLSCSRYAAMQCPYNIPFGLLTTNLHYHCH